MTYWAIDLYSEGPFLRNPLWQLLTFTRISITLVWTKRLRPVP